MLADGMMLYHGSYARVERIDLTRCRPGKDFGAGFYLTSSPEQARAFIRSSLRKAQSLGLAPEDAHEGYVSTFEYHAPHDTIPVFEFETADAPWLWFIAQNRKRSSAHLLRQRLDPTLLAAEIVVGKIANDATNRVIAAYLEGLYGPLDSEMATQTAIAQLMPDRLHDQACFLSQKAIGCLEFKEAHRYGR